jgi:aspartate kinase
MERAMSSGECLTVVKIGGSVLAGLADYQRASSFLRGLVAASAPRIVAVVSAELGHTDALFCEAQHFGAVPRSAALDLLWSTGELRSVALLTLALQADGVHAAGLNVHETGLRLPRGDGPSRPQVAFNSIAIRAAIGKYDVVVVPGFLATSGQRVVTLGRGGSDRSAVLLAAALGAASCVLIKDVDGYYTDDPRRNPGADLLPALSFSDALQMADAGCPLVQRQAIADARDLGVELVVRSFESSGTVLISEECTHGFRDQDDSCRTAGRAADRRRRFSDISDDHVSAAWAR